MRDAHAPTSSSCWRWLPTPLDSAKSCLSYTNGWSYGHKATTNIRGASAVHQSIGSEVQEPDREDDHRSRSGQPSPDGSLNVREREDSVGLTSPPSYQPRPRVSLLGSCNSSATSLARISGAFCSRSRSRNEAQVQVQAAVAVHSTIHMSQCLAVLSCPCGPMQSCGLSLSRA
jgi:hypothetical protein